MSATLHLRHGSRRPLPVELWTAPADRDELALLGGLAGPVLDLGCGPGRLVAALVERGVPALGVDASPLAVARARTLGAPVLQRSVFEALPGEGRWASVLLFDGNVGIGGDPVALFGRLERLLGPEGVAVVEVDPPGTGSLSTQACIERDGTRSEWFPWACVDADRVEALAGAASLVRHRWEVVGGRWFAVLGKGDPT